jgi:predicted SAM-dependent methyltransferase
MSGKRQPRSRASRPRPRARRSAPRSLPRPDPKALPAGADTLGHLRAAGLWRDGQPLRLHLGCGAQHFDGYVNIEQPPSEPPTTEVKADVYADVTRLDFPPDSVDEVRSHHLFEHFSRTTALAMLLRWHRWLKVGGRLRVETPDLVGSAATLVSTAPWSTKMAVVRHLAGDQAAWWGYHVDHWFAERFQKTLTRLGFHDVWTRCWSWEHPPYLSNVEVVAAKTAGVSPAAQLRIADAVLRESMVAPSERQLYETWRRQLRRMVNGRGPAPTPGHE